MIVSPKPSQSLRHGLVALFCVAGGIALILLMVNRVDWWWGLVAAGSSVVVSLIATIAVLMVAGAQKPEIAALAALVPLLTGMVRLFVAVAVVVLLIVAGEYPPIPSVLLLIPLYLSVLFAETRLICVTQV